MNFHHSSCVIHNRFCTQGRCIWSCEVDFVEIHDEICQPRLTPLGTLQHFSPHFHATLTGVSGDALRNYSATCGRTHHPTVCVRCMLLNPLLAALNVDAVGCTCQRQSTIGKWQPVQPVVSCSLIVKFFRPRVFTQALIFFLVWYRLEGIGGVSNGPHHGQPCIARHASVLTSLVCKSALNFARSSLTSKTTVASCKRDAVIFSHPMEWKYLLYLTINFIHFLYYGGFHGCAVLPSDMYSGCTLCF